MKSENLGLLGYGPMSASASYPTFRRTPVLSVSRAEKKGSELARLSEATRID